MGYVKLVKNREYYKRYKVKMRRRRNHLTNYKQRRQLITQDKRKYDAPKWRFIVRITNQYVVCQVAASKVTGDEILCAAYSHELKRYGLTVGLTNYAACYCTGLLLARRLLKKIQLDTIYKGKKKLDGRRFLSRISNIDWTKLDRPKPVSPFKCLLDKGLAASTTGARIFAAMKGGVDGGLEIPHSAKRFPGYVRNKGEEKDEYNADTHAHKIYGGHVADYMKLLKEENPEKYQKQFSQYVIANIGPDDMKQLYTDVHKKIRENPVAPPKKQRDIKGMKLFPAKPKKLTLEQRQQRRIEKIQAMNNAPPKESKMEEDDE